MAKSFEQVKQLLVEELKAKLLKAAVNVKYYRNQAGAYDEMSKHQAEEQLGIWEKNKMEMERQLKRFEEFDVTALKEYDI